MRRGPTILLLILLLVASAFGAQRVLGAGWTRVTGFTPIRAAAETPATGIPELAKRVVVVVAEGLRRDDASLLPTVDLLQRTGASYGLDVPQPGYLVPAVATLLTGASPTFHGVLLSSVYQALSFDHFPGAARRAGITVGGVGSAELGTLLGPTIPWTAATDPGEVRNGLQRLLAAGGPRLVLVHLNSLRTSVRELGAPSLDNPDYKELLADLDAQLVYLLERVDLTTTAIVVVGVSPVGSIGALSANQPVPMVLSGAGVRPGQHGTASLPDVAPTIAALLGSPTPIQAEGQPLLEALTVSDRPADVIMQRYLAARKVYADASLQALGSTAIAADPPSSANGAPGYRQALDQQIASARLSAWKNALMQRLPYFGGAFLLVLLYLLLAYRQRYGGALLLSTVVYAAIFHLLFFSFGGRYSATMSGLDALNQHLVARLGLITATAMTAASLICGYLLSRRGFKKGAYLTAASMHMMLSSVIVVALPVAVGVLFVGWEFPVTLPAPGLLVWFFVTALQVIVIGYMSPIWAILTVTASRIAGRLWPLKEIGDPERNADKVVRMKALRRSAKG